MLKAETLDIKDLLNKIHLYDDQKSFEIVFHHYFDRLYRVAFSIVKRHEIAEEIVEDVFFKFWQMKDRYALIKNLDNYLFVATKNGAYDYLKMNAKNTWSVPNKQTHVLCHFISPERSYLVEELREQIEHAVNGLPPKCRRIFEMVRHEGLSNKLTAEKLGVSVKTVENQMTIAIKKIAKELEPYLYEAHELPYSQIIMALLFCLFVII